MALDFNVMEILSLNATAHTLIYSVYLYTVDDEYNYCKTQHVT